VVPPFFRTQRATALSKTAQLAISNPDVEIIADCPDFLQGDFQMPGQLMGFFAREPVVFRGPSNRIDDFIPIHTSS
jgi:hypothetical protein